MMNATEWGTAAFRAAAYDEWAYGSGLLLPNGFEYEYHRGDNGMLVLDNMKMKEYLDNNQLVKATDTNWMDEIFRTAFYQRHNVALNVGSDNFSNRISFAYDNDEGVLINTFKKNLTLRYNGKMQLNKWVSVSEDFVWQNTTQRSKATDNDAYTGPILSAIYMPASATVYNPLDGSYGGVTTEDPAYIEKYLSLIHISEPTRH